MLPSVNKQRYPASANPSRRDSRARPFALDLLLHRNPFDQHRLPLDPFAKLTTGRSSCKVRNPLVSLPSEPHRRSLRRRRPNSRQRTALAQAPAEASWVVTRAEADRSACLPFQSATVPGSSRRSTPTIRLPLNTLVDPRSCFNSITQTLTSKPSPPSSPASAALSPWLRCPRRPAAVREAAGLF